MPYLKSWSVGFTKIAPEPLFDAAHSQGCGLQAQASRLMAGSPGGVLDLDVLSDLPGGDDPANIPFPPLVADWATSTPLTAAERAAVAAAVAAGRVQRAPPGCGGLD